MGFLENYWYSVKKDGPPPFDRLCVVRGVHPEFKFYQYATAYNECYRPEMALTQRVELDKEHEGKLPVYLSVPFEVTDWMLLPMTPEVK